MIIRTIMCGICKVKERENTFGEGWPGWIQVMGLENKEDQTKTNPHICPHCKKPIVELMNRMEVK